MTKLILGTKHFDLLKDAKKKFGVVFHPNTPIFKIGNTIERLYATKYNNKPQTISTILQDDRQNKKIEKFVEKRGVEET
jgi:hypothetical protein